MNHLKLRNWKRIVAVAMCLAGWRFALGQEAAPAGSADNAFLWASIRPPGGEDDWAVVDLRAYLMRDAGGEIESGGITWRLRYNVSGQFQASGFRIHQKSDAGVGQEIFRQVFRAPVQLRGSGAAGGSVADMGINIAVRSGDRAALTAFRRLLNNPAEHVVSLEVEGQPETAFTAPLWWTDRVVLMSLLNPGSEPTAALFAYAFVARDAANRVAYGELLFSGSYRFPAQVTFTSLRIQDRENGPALITAPLTTLASAPTGSSQLPGLFARIVPEDLTAYRAFLDLLENPERFWVVLETSGAGQTALRGSLRKTDRMKLPLYMDSRSVVPPPANWEDRSVWLITLYTVRNEDGSIAAAVWENTMNMRCPEAFKLLGTHVHEGRAGTTGPVVLAFETFTPETATFYPTGFGGGHGIRAYTFMDGAMNELINALVRNPEAFYMDVHIERFPDGASRAQFGHEPGLPVIHAVMSANLDSASRVAAPGGLISIFGRNLAKVGTNIDGWEGVMLPDSLNGVAVGIGSLTPRPILVSASQIIAVLPMETPSGTVQLAVNNGAALSQPFSFQVASAAPALFAHPILKVSDFSQINAMNPAQAGDVIAVYLTGLGQTTPPLASGAVVNETISYNTVPVGVTIDGKEAYVLASTARPGIPGLYQVILRVPPGTSSGNVPLVLQAASTGSNPVPIALR